ncbi:MAG: SDR family oxidoreductase [Verrucomicrobiaceae bacterium]|nr:SDR family oxidoreductase [Verrucomicrobiaceae bacterium]
MTRYEQLQDQLRARPARWLVTGGAGFIGSHLVETLLSLGQEVVMMDSLITGRRSNIDDVLSRVPSPVRANFRFIDGDVRDLDTCRRACEGAHYVLHQAGLGSVPRSLERPADTHAANVTGTLHMLMAAREAGARRMTYASSSSVYGDDEGLPKIESRTGQPLSPYAASKAMCEGYGRVFWRCFKFSAVGLRYFNVFGPRQDPDGPYAAVVPKWVAALRNCEPVFINGDGTTSRDFCYVANVVQANLLAATSENPDVNCQVMNVALGGRTTLNDLFAAIRDGLAAHDPDVAQAQPVYRDFRAGDIRHSQADITLAQTLLGYAPTHRIEAGLREALAWYAGQA